MRAADVVDEMVAVRPAPALRRFVERYVGYRQSGIPAGSHRGLPAPWLTVIFTLDDPLVVSLPPNPSGPGERFDSLIGGLHTGPALITHAGRQSGVQLALSPLGVRALLGLPAGALSGLDLPAADLLGPLAGETSERLRAASGWPERFAVLDRMLVRRLDRRSEAAPDLAPGVARAWQALRASGGTVPIARVAAEVGWSSRRLGQQFGVEVGLSPKAVARVIRFDRARWALQRRVAAGSVLDLADLAARCGYFDQAHLAREFRSLAGVPPSTWVAEEFRNVQAHGPLQEAG